ncbi:MAG: phosphoribosylanthranilate isomerase, partial [Verrucomicrobiota bacterium]
RGSAKICGIVDGASAASCARLGAAAIGLNFWPRSKRFVGSVEQLGWVSECPAGLARVGVFVNPSFDEVLSLWTGEMIHAAQLHGDEDPEFCQALQAEGILVIKALAVRDRDSLKRMSDYPVSAVVLDAFCPGLYGGSGKTIDWDLASEAVENEAGQKIILSGGLKADNVAEAVRRVKPWAVDVASGVEDSPGVKNWKAVEAFVQGAAG